MQLALSPRFIHLLYFIYVSLLSSCVFSPDLAAIQAQLLPYKMPTISNVQPDIVFTGGGTEIEITGENFISGVSVTIAGKDCAIQRLIGTTKIVCLAPSSAEGSFEVVLTGVDGKTVSSPISYDGLAFTKLSLLIGKLDLALSTTNQDGYFNNGDSLGATQMSVEGSSVYSADYDGDKIKLTTLTDLYSKTLIGNDSVSHTTDITIADIVTPSTTVILPEALSFPTCLAKYANTLYFCITSKAIGKIDLTLKNGATTLVAGEITADANVYPPTDPRGVKFDNIKKIFILGDDLYIVDTDTIKKISALSTANPTLSTIAGTAGAFATPLPAIDGNGTTAVFESIHDAELLGEKLYIIDGQGNYSNLVRSLDLSMAGNYAVSTVIGDLLVPLSFGDVSVDGNGASGTINKVYGITKYANKLLLLEESPPDDNYKIRIFDPALDHISTIKTITASSKHVLGKLGDTARLRYYRVRGIKYIDYYGLVIGTQFGLLRIQ